MILYNKEIYNAISVLINKAQANVDEDQEFTPNFLVESLSNFLSSIVDTVHLESLSESLRSLLANNFPPSVEDVLSIVQPYLDQSLSMHTFNVTPSTSIGFHSIFDQIKLFLFERGLDLNVMIVGISIAKTGRTGSGKSTLFDTLFKSQVALTHHSPAGQSKLLHWPDSCLVRSIRHVIDENGLRIRLCLYDTLGYGDLVDNSNCNFSIISTIKDLYEHYRVKELQVDRSRILFDGRIHACIYVIPPNGHCLSELDIRFMSDLSSIVNVIPVIGRSDSLNQDELVAFKKRIRDELLRRQIQCYPTTRFILQSEDTSAKTQFTSLSESLPLAVIGANFFDTQTNKLLRKTQFGDIDVFDPKFSDLHKLNDILIRKHTLNLIHTTESVFYENYRKAIIRHSH